MVHVSSENDLNATEIGKLRNSAFVAGNVAMLITSSNGTQRRSLDKGITHGNAHDRRGSENGCRVVGDLNRDCQFNVIDVRYLLTYLAESAESFESSLGHDILVRTENNAGLMNELDIDGNGQINTKDAVYLKEINLGIFNFITSVGVQSANQSSGCFLSINVTLDGSTAMNPNVTFIFAVLTQSFDWRFALDLNTSAFVQGSLVAVVSNRDHGVYGGVVALSFDAVSGSFGAVIGSAMNQSDIGLSVVQATVIDGSLNVRFIGGGEHGEFQSNTSFNAVVEYGSMMISINSPGFSGFNPHVEFNSTVKSNDCFSTFGCQSPYQYQFAPATLLVRPDCRQTLVCNSSEYQTVAPTYTSDRTCHDLTVCFDVTQAQLWNNSIHLTGEAEPALQYESVGASATSDRACAYVSGACGSGYYEADAPTATSDRVCFGLHFILRVFLLFSFFCYRIYC